MNNRYLHLRFLGFAILFSFCIACKKEKVNDTDGGFPIELSVEKPGRNIQLNWTETKISDFESYIVVRSVSPIPDNPTPPSGTIANISDYKTPSFEDTSFPFAETIYYKVYVKIGERFLYSPTVKFTNSIKLLNFAASRAIFDEENGLAYMFDGNKSRLYKYDYLTEKLLDSLTFSGVFDVKMAVGNHGNGNELYVAPNGNFSIDIYNADNLDFKTSMPVNGFVLSIASGNNDLLYVSTDNWQNSFAVYQRSTKQFKSGDSSFSGGGETNLKVMSADGLTVLSSTFNNVIKYKISAQGIIIDFNFANFQNSFFGIVQEVALSDDRQFFIPEITGTVMNKNLETVGTLSSNNNFFIFSATDFSAAGDKIWGIRSSPNELLEFSFPGISQTSTLTLGYQPVWMRNDGNDLIIIGLANDGIGITKTIVDKIKV
jgi:hypothetical protein